MLEMRKKKFYSKMKAERDSAVPGRGHRKDVVRLSDSQEDPQRR